MNDRVGSMIPGGMTVRDSELNVRRSFPGERKKDKSSGRRGEKREKRGRVNPGATRRGIDEKAVRGVKVCKPSDLYIMGGNSTVK